MWFKWRSQKSVWRRVFVHVCASLADSCSKPEGADTRMLLIPDRERYENGDKIDYGCLSGPNRGSRGKATCKNGEWSKTIECQAFAKCALSLPPTRGTSYRPADRNLFLPDE
uniref:Sushi domain-containing protein n=1 Tax=Oncorhynchus tshawytscha TaxID=74940 RepID=A0AAZ3RH40_ONCTS